MTMNDIGERLKASLYTPAASRVMDRMGYEPRRSAAEKIAVALGVFGAGLVIGAGLGLLFAPKSGAELRGDVRHGVEKIGGKARDLGSRVLPGSNENARARVGI
jgi:hypothetical protein